jgi:cobalt-zinc-cadmium efflux system outer membrane protein
MRLSFAVHSAGIVFRSVGTVLLCTILLSDAAPAQVAPPRAPVTLRRPGAATVDARADSLLFLHALYDLVDRANPRVRAASELARAVAARVSGVTKPPDPELQLGFMNYSLPRLAPDATLGMRQLQLMQMVPLPGKLAAAGDAARARAQAAGARATDIRWDARATTAMAFYERWSASERIEIARATRRLLEDAAAVATAMYRVGDGRQSDVLRARVEIARMDEEIIRMQVMNESARARLAAAVDLPESAVDGTPVLPVFPDTIPQRSDLQLLALRNRSMLAAGAADVRAAVADERLARRERWPDMLVGVQYGERGMEMGTDRMGSLMVGASLPIFARSRQLPMRVEAAAMRAMSEAELRSMQADTRARVAEVHAELTRARRLTALYLTTVLPQAEAAAASSLASYRSGSVDFMTVIENRMVVNRYREEVVTLTAAEGRAWADLEMLISQSLLAPAGTR